MVENVLMARLACIGSDILRGWTGGRRRGLSFGFLGHYHSLHAEQKK